MNKNSNSYIIIYSTVMVVIVALVLAVASLSLKSKQQANEDNETKGAILMSIGQGMDADKAPDKTAYIDAEYAKYIPESFVVDYKGDKVEGADAFALLGSLKAEYAKSETERQLPVFVSKSDSGEPLYIFPLWGSGLWGPIWGYLALESDMMTISGAVFAHKSETPGLGAEIATPAFQGQFKGKSIFNGDELVGISVLKGAGSSAGNPNAVDAISGGTITSKGVEAMLMASAKGYAGFIAKNSIVDAKLYADPSVIENQPLTVEENE